MIFADEPTFVETTFAHGFVPDEPRCATCNQTAPCLCPDEPRRIEPDWAYLDDDEPELSQWADEHGYVWTPGQWPSPIAGI